MPAQIALRHALLIFPRSGDLTVECHGHLTHVKTATRISGKKDLGIFTFRNIIAHPFTEHSAVDEGSVAAAVSVDIKFSAGKFLKPDVGVMSAHLVIVRTDAYVAVLASYAHTDHITVDCRVDLRSARKCPCQLAGKLAT